MTSTDRAQGLAGTTFPRECAGFVAGRGFRLEGMLGGYAFRSPSDLLVVAADETGGSVVTLGDELTVWDAASGGRRASYPWAGDALAVARDGRTAAVGQRTGAVALVDLTSGAALWEASIVQGDEGSLARGIQPPVQYLAMAGGVVAAIVETGENIHILRDGRTVARLAGEGPLALSPDGTLLVAGPRLHDLTTGEHVLTFEPGAAVTPGAGDAQMSARHRASFSRDGARLAHTDPGGTVDLWNVPSVRARHGVNARIFSAVMPVAPWDRQGRSEPAGAVFLLDDGTVVTSTGSALQVWNAGAIVRTVAFHADTVCLGAGAGTWGVRRRRSIVNVDVATGASAGQAGHLAEVKAIAHSPRAPLALTGGGDARVLLWHLPSCTVLRELPDAWGTIEGAIFFPDGRRVAAIDTERMFVWDAATRELVSKLDRVSPRESGLRQNLDLDASPDGKHALVCTYSDHVLLWDAEAQRTVYTREVEGVRSAAFGSAPSIAILGSWKELVVFDLARGEPLRRIEVEHDSAGHRAHLVFDQGRRAVRPCSGRGLFVYDLETSQRSLVPVTDDVHHLLALSHDGAVAAVSTSDDPTAGTPVLRPEVALVRLQGGARTTIPLATADDRPTCASFSGDGATLLVGTVRGVVLRFALDDEVASQAHPGRPSVASVVGAAPGSAPGSTPDEAATRVMSAFPDMRATPASGTPAVSSQAHPPMSHVPATAPSPGERVIVAPPRVPSAEDGPLSSFHPLGTTSPRAGVGPSSAKPGTLEAKREEAIGILRRVGALYARGAYNEALAFAAPLRRHLFDSFPPGDPLVAAAVANLAELHTKVGELKEAEALHQEALERIPRTAGESSEAFATTLSNAGNFALEVRDLARAEQLHRRALDIRRVLHGDRHPLTAQSTSSLGFVLARMGRSDLAEPLYRAAIDAFRSTVGPTHPEHAKTLHNLGVLVGQAGRFQESEAMLVDSLATRRAVLAEGHLDVAQGLASLGTLYLVSKRPAQAEPLYREALELSRRSLGDAAVETSTRAVDLAVALRALGRPAEAVPLLTRALEVRVAKLPPDDARVANVRRMLAELS